ncbi:MAG: hypothetical protein IID03_02720 [Candidatus Dadabacteria bacterium]|nr:hypothetical protein [Candidatus Dadabacteria bacterium]
MYILYNMVNYILITIIALLGIGVTCITSYKQYYSKENRNTRTFWALVAIIAIIAVLTIVVNYSLYRSDKQQKHEINTYKGKIDTLVDSNARLEEDIAIIKEFALKHYPNLSTTAAVQELIKDLEQYKQRTKNLEEKTKETRFLHMDQGRKKLPDGTYESKFILIPIGNNIIPIFKIACKTENGAKINSFNLKGKTLPPMSEVGKSPDQTSATRIFRNMEPGNVEAVINTDINPGKLHCITNILEK